MITLNEEEIAKLSISDLWTAIRITEKIIIRCKSDNKCKAYTGAKRLFAAELQNRILKLINETDESETNS